MEHFQAPRHVVYRVLESRTASGPWHRAVHTGLVLLIIVNAVAVLFDDAGSSGPEWIPWLVGFERASVALFTLEYLCRLWVAVEGDEVHGMSPLRARLHYMFSAAGVIDLAAILPFYLGFMGAVDLRYLRLLRLFWLLKLSRFSPALQSLAAAFYQERRSFLGALLIVIVLLLTSATVEHLLERTAQPEAFGTIVDSMWWAIVTLTTVGYGDVVPHTPLGKVFGGMCALAGLCLFALPAGIMASSFVEQIKRRDFVVNAKLVSQVPLFAGVGVMHMVEIATMLKPRAVPPLYTVVRKGDPADCMYFVLSGELEVQVTPTPVHLHSGDFFGEMGLLDHAPRTATITAVTDSQLLMLEEEDFHKLMRAYPEMRAAIEAAARARRAPAPPARTPAPVG
ncbi:MAG TPA: cyclic nucleotide-gated ion channel [Candidatus Sulfotelmatobacter sp.]|nr:cyclic nucleotide-gated ion channel [Candidatus Sulfotelmatobacter sp.]